MATDIQSVARFPGGPVAATAGVLDPVGTASSVRRRGWAGRVYLPAVVVAVATAGVLWVGLRALAHSGGLAAGLGAGWTELVAPPIVALVVVLLVCERLWPAEPREPRARGHVQDGAYLVLHVVAFVPVMVLLSVAFGSVLFSHARWMEVPWTASWPRWLLLGVTLVLMDGANWLAHWADHRFAPLWRMHALHHSQEEVNVLTSFRAHPLSHLAGFFLATIPVIVLMGGQGMAPALVVVYICLSTFPHANVNWTLGPVGRVVVTPAYHRLHHSADGTNGYNLGVVLTVWDVLAGRALFPTAGQPVCRTGLAGRPVPTEQSAGRWSPALLFTQLTEPFRARPPAGSPPGTPPVTPGAAETFPIRRSELVA
jgi:sterol desaturase/sphingolipid hydroxylase (fatty acid hydroxylase superfamily)